MVLDNPLQRWFEFGLDRFCRVPSAFLGNCILQKQGHVREVFDDLLYAASRQIPSSTLDCVVVVSFQRPGRYRSVARVFAVAFASTLGSTRSLCLFRNDSGTALWVSVCLLGNWAFHLPQRRRFSGHPTDCELGTSLIHVVFSQDVQSLIIRMRAAQACQTVLFDRADEMAMAQRLYDNRIVTWASDGGVPVSPLQYGLDHYIHKNWLSPAIYDTPKVFRGRPRAKVILKAAPAPDTAVRRRNYVDISTRAFAGLAWQDVPYNLSVEVVRLYRQYRTPKWQRMVSAAVLARPRLRSHVTAAFSNCCQSDEGLFKFPDLVIFEDIVTASRVNGMYAGGVFRILWPLTSDTMVTTSYEGHFRNPRAPDARELWRAVSQ